MELSSTKMQTTRRINVFPPRNVSTSGAESYIMFTSFERLRYKQLLRILTSSSFISSAKAPRPIQMASLLWMNLDTIDRWVHYPTYSLISTAQTVSQTVCIQFLCTADPSRKKRLSKAEHRFFFFYTKFEQIYEWFSPRLMLLTKMQPASPADVAMPKLAVHKLDNLLITLDCLHSRTIGILDDFWTIRGILDNLLTTSISSHSTFVFPFTHL